MPEKIFSFSGHSLLVSHDTAPTYPYHIHSEYSSEKEIIIMAVLTPNACYIDEM